jgi:hypothetical protein
LRTIGDGYLRYILQRALGFDSEQVGHFFTAAEMVVAALGKVLALRVSTASHNGRQVSESSGENTSTQGFAGLSTSNSEVAAQVQPLN